MTLPQQISYITLGVRDMANLRAFYAQLGWHERPGSSDDFVTYQAGGVLSPSFRLGTSAKKQLRGNHRQMGRGTGSRLESMSKARKLST